MKKSPTQYPERLQDPLGVYLGARLAAHEQRMRRFAPVDEIYGGLYATFRPQDKDGMMFLGGAEGIVGTELAFESFDEGLGLVARDGRRIALLDEALAERFTGLREEGWVIRPFLAYTVYRVEDRSFIGNLACFYYSPQLDEETRSALDAFIGNMVERIAGGLHPQLDLSQEQFVKVVESKGAWYLTRELPWPELPQGSAFYRRRRNFSDRLISAGLEGNKGCLVATWTGATLVIVAILVALWWLFL